MQGRERCDFKCFVVAVVKRCRLHGGMGEGKGERERERERFKLVAFERKFDLRMVLLQMS